MKINRKILFFGFILVIILFGIFIYFRNNEIVNNDSNNPKEEKNIYAESAFTELLKDFELENKKSIVFLEKKEESKLIESSDKSRDIWSYIYNNYKNRQDSQFLATKDWSKKLELIYESVISINNNIHNKKLEEVYTNLDSIRRQLRDIRRENNISNINDQMLDFYDSFFPVISAKDKEETKPYMQNLKLKFLFLKKLDRGSDYNKVISKIEKSISGIDSLVASDFEESQKNLYLNFQDLYIGEN